MFGARLDPDSLQNFRKTNASPFGIANRPGIPLDARDFFDAIEFGSPISRAGQCGGHGRELKSLSQFRQTQLTRLVDESFQGECKAFLFEFRDVSMTANEKGGGRCQPAFIQFCQRGFGVVGGLGPDDQSRFGDRLLGQQCSVSCHHHRRQSNAGTTQFQEITATN